MNNKYIQGAINILCIPILTILLIIGIYNIIINYKLYIILLINITTIITILLCIFYCSKKRTLYNISQYIATSINLILLFNIILLNNNYSYISNLSNNKYIYLNNSMYVLKNTKYRKFDQLASKKIGILKQNSENTVLLMNNILKADYIEYETTNEMISALYDGQIQSIILNTNEIETLKLKSNKLLKDARSIYEIKIKNEI